MRLARSRTEPAAGRLAVLVLVTCAGYAAGRAAGHGEVTRLVTEHGYLLAVSALLAVGLYGSTHGIDTRTLRADARVVVLAVTVGVLLKAALITAGMALAVHHPEVLVLGVAVAQIDPLSVAALERSSRLTPRGKVLLLAWASFDDPMTTLLTVYAAALALRFGAGNGGAAPPALTGGAGAFAWSTALNLLFAAVLAGLWFGARWARRRWEGRREDGGVLPFAAGCALLLAALAVGVDRFWMLGIALAGLFLRPALARAPELFSRVLGALTYAAFLLGTLAVGVVLSTGVRPWAGLWLGVVTFTAQIVVSLPLTRGRPPGDRVRLALAQQNGITAIVLALLLQPMFDGVVATVAPAILVINLLHLAANARYDARLDARRGPVVDPPPPAPPLPAPPQTAPPLAAPPLPAPPLPAP
uniref:hypothetical protein n=1 Tax=Actinomadura roseirufa TaxID=2094049 RepID=UPI0013F17243